MNEEIKEFVEQNPHLVRVKHDPQTGLRVLKYHNRVFYDNLWYISPMLRKLRGMVVDEDYHPIIYPFDKTFNYKENDTVIPLNEKVVAVRKVNGFMASVRYVEPWGLLVSTTGTLTSDFANLARKHISRFEDKIKLFPSFTFIFEIVDESDPHIVAEKEGAYLIGAREMIRYTMLTPEELSSRIFATNCTWQHIGDYVLKPHFMDFEEVLRQSKTAKHEGWMVYGKTTTLKLKTPYYLTTKLLGRMSVKKMGQYLETRRMIPWLDEDFQWVLERLAQKSDFFLDKSTEDRVSYVRELIDER